MPRYAIGDLTIDLDVPARFKCEYALNGALVGLDASCGAALEVSGLHLGTKSGPQAARDSAAQDQAKLLRDTPQLVLYAKNPQAWLAGWGTHLVIATVKKPELIPELESVLASVGPAHDPFPADEKTAFSDLKPSHTRWFEQRRSSLIDAVGYSPESSRAAQTLDAFWEELREAPPEEEHLLNTMLSGFALGFGDLLVKQLDFQWVVAKDPWGISLGVVALRGTANLLIVPDSFVAKRWESREPRFVEGAMRSIAETVAKAQADWKKH